MVARCIGSELSSDSNRGALGQLVPWGRGSLAWWVLPPPARGVGREGSPSEQGLGRETGAQGCIFATHTHIPPAVICSLTWLCTPLLRTVSSPPQPHDGSLKIPHAIRQMGFPHISQNHQISLTASRCHPAQGVRPAWHVSAHFL